MLDEEERMTEYLMQNQDIMNLGLLLLFQTGLRIGELSVLIPADISKTPLSAATVFNREPLKEMLETLNLDINIVCK